jgi:hypothetical protein
MTPDTRPLHCRRLALVVFVAAAALGLSARAAGPLAEPSGPVVLSVTGTVERANRDGRADFDMAMLEALPQHSFVTATPWFKTARRFSGPLLRDVIAAAGAKGDTLNALALNGYKVEIPTEDSQNFKVLMATRLDDQPMSVRDKGPLLIIYPYDDNADLRAARYYNRSAWQLRTLHVK